MTKTEFTDYLNSQRGNGGLLDALYTNQSDGFNEFLERNFYDEDEDGFHVPKELDEEQQAAYDMSREDETRIQKLVDVEAKMLQAYFEYKEVPEELRSIKVVNTEWDGPEEVTMVIHSPSLNFYAKSSTSWSSYGGVNHDYWRPFKIVEPIDRTVRFYE